MYRIRTCDIMRLRTVIANGRFRFPPGSSLHPKDRAFQVAAASPEIAKHTQCHKDTYRRRSILRAISTYSANNPATT